MGQPQAILKVNENGDHAVQAIDLQTGADLLHALPVEALRLNCSAHDRRLSLELSPWAFNYDTAPADVVLTFRGERIKAIVIGDDVCSRTVPVAELIREATSGKQKG
jgi:hypothetical protein